MKISKLYQSPVAKDLIACNSLAAQAYDEVGVSIIQNCTNGYDHFIINCSSKNCNGVVPIKNGIYFCLEKNYKWFREKPLPYFKNDAKKGGPIDVYKEFGKTNHPFRVGLEFETGNISSAHRAMNKLHIGIEVGNIDMGMLILPIKNLAFYLTDRISNYEELEPYFPLVNNVPFIIFGFDADIYDTYVPLLSKGRDGMSPRAIHRWKD